MQAVGRSGSIGIAIACTLFASTARANGSFPSSGQIFTNPVAPSELDVRTTYGLVRTIDQGASYRLVCEDALGYGNGFHPQMGMTKTGLVFMGLPDGLAVEEANRCGYRRAPELEGLYVGDVSVDKNGRLFAIATMGTTASYVYVSTNDGATWATFGVPLPAKFQPLTIDAARGDTDHVYVSGLTGTTAPKGAVTATTDAGANWVTSLVDESDAGHAPYIAAIDPLDDARVFLRLSGAPGQLMVTDDGATTFVPIFTATGFLRAFSMAPDGSFALFGGETDGVLRLDLSTLVATPTSSLGVRCLSIAGPAVYACGDELMDGFTAARSLDDGANFEPILHQQCILGPLACAAGTPVGDLCGAAWPAISSQLKTQDCMGAGGAAATSSVSSSGASTSATSTGSGDGGGAATGPGGGCSCSVEDHGSADTWPAAIAVAAAFTIRRREKR